MANRNRRLRRYAILTAVSVTAPAVALVVAASPAQAAPSYDAVARATGVLFTASNPSIPAGLIITGGAPEADVHQTSLGQGDANASVPYIGEIAPGLVGVFAGILGVPSPPYPLVASSTRGSAPVTTKYPGITMMAESTPFSSVARALIGEAASGASSAARIDEDRSGGVIASATSDASALTLGGVVTMSNYSSVASVAADGSSGELTRTASLSVGRISVPGLSIDIPKTTPGRLFVPSPIPGVPSAPPAEVPTIPFAQFGGTKLPVPDVGFVDGYFTTTLPGLGPQKYLLPADAVIAAFKAQGVTLTYQAAEQTTTGVIAPNLAVSYVAASLPDNQYFSGPTPVTYSLGSTVASVSLRPVLTPTLGNPAAVGTAGAVPGVVDAGSAPGALGLPSTVDPAVGPLPTGGELPQAVVTPVASAGGPAVSAFDISDLYLVLVAVAVGAFVTGTGLTLIGVRNLWTS